MKDANVKEVKSINERLFERMARFECECSVDTVRSVPCGMPAAKVVEWRHQDGDRERQIMCGEHATQQQRYWSAMDWDTAVAISDIEDWEVTACYRGKTATRVGSRFHDAAA